MGDDIKNGGSEEQGFFLILEAKLCGFDQLGVLQINVSNCYSSVLKTLVVLLASFLPGPFSYSLFPAI